MRKAIAYALVVSLAAVVVIAAGCGSGDTTKAQSYMKVADRIMAGVAGRYPGLEQTITKLVAEYAAGVNTEPAGVKAKIAEITASVRRASRDVLAARREYAKILGLKGVDDYVKYAQIQMRVANKIEEANALILKLVGVIGTASSTGQPPDTAGLAALGARLRAVGTQVTTLTTQAQEFKIQKELPPNNQD
jgi:hypothetical protein